MMSDRTRSGERVEVPIRIGVCGGGTTDRAGADTAEAVGRGIAEAGAVLVCGGRGGIMEAAARGAAEAGGLTFGILPGAEASSANPYIRLPLPTGMGEGRNVLVVRAADAVIAIDGEWGTLSEVALARKIGVPVVLLGGGLAERLADRLGLERTDDPARAVTRALELAAQRRRS
ncbi:MAG: TIGR00725 family protein [Gemmatimonadota bacterium]